MEEAIKKIQENTTQMNFVKSLHELTNFYELTFEIDNVLLNKLEP